MKYLKKSFLFLLIILFFLPVYISATSQDKTYGNTTVTVLKIIDGDTLKIRYKGKKESIRLIGIDTPETRKNNKAYRDAKISGKDIDAIISQGKKATSYVKSLVKKGDMIQIEFDIQTRDKYGRFLGYVYLKGEKMLNEEIVKAGYANLMTIPPNVKYQERFLKAYRKARKNNKGLWRK
jgi:micrococcal nuclease